MFVQIHLIPLVQLNWQTVDSEEEARCELSYLDSLFASYSMNCQYDWKKKKRNSAESIKYESAKLVKQLIQLHLEQPELELGPF